jgi:hypothetical protein
MRLDARKGDCGWKVFDCRHMREIEYVVWVDEAAAQYGAWKDRNEQRACLLSGRDSPEATQADRIAIITTSRLILIDPIADEELDLIEVAISRPVPLDA